MSQILDFISDSKIDIALIQKTWLGKTDSPLVAQIREYNFEVIQIRKPRFLDMGGGVAILYKNKLNLKLFKTETFSSFEHVTCTALMETGKIYFTTVYYPGYSTKHKYTHMQFLSDFNNFLVLKEFN